MSLLSANDWAKNWHHTIGVNVIPSTNKHDNPDLCKKPFWTDENKKQQWIKWKELGYQTNPITEDQFNEWIRQDAFKDGMAIICGQIWRGENKGLWINGIDCDNKLAIDEMCPSGIRKVAEITIVEQHSNKEKCHIYFLTKEPIQSQTRLEGKDIPQIEIKSHGKFLSYCAGGIHKDGSLIEIIGIDKIKTVDGIELEKRIDDIFKKYDLEYLIKQGITEYKKSIHEVSKKLHEGNNRSVHILSYLDSKKIKNPEFNEDDLFQLALKYQKENCVEQYDDKKIRELVKQGFEFGLEKIAERESKTEEKQTSHEPKHSKEKSIIDDTARDIKSKYDFVTISSTNEILLYNGKIYDKTESESIIKSETEKIIKNCTTHDRQEVINKIKAQTYKNLESFDIDSNLITLENGILDLETLELKPHNPDYLSRVLLPVEYSKPLYDINDETIFEDIEKNLKDTLFYKSMVASFTVDMKFRLKDFQTVLEIVASPIIKRHIDEKAFMFLGNGENGKSVCLHYIRSLLSDKNISRIALQQIAEDKFMTANLLGMSANIFTDLESGELKHAGKIKAITSGEGLEAQFKYGNPFTLNPFCKLMFSCNRFPKIYDQSQGFFRRWIIVKWDRNFENDPERIEYLREKLTESQEEKNKVFSCLVYLARRLNKIGKFTYSKDWKTTQKEWNENADPVDWFVSNYIIDSDENKTKRETYQFYKEIMLEKGESPLGIGQFSKAFAQYHDEYITKEGRTERVWLNIDFKRPVQTTLKEVDNT